MSSKSSKSESQSPLPEFVSVGRIGKPHGIRGEVVVEVLSDVAERFAVGAEVDIVDRGGERRRIRIAASRIGQGKAIVLFEGLETREQAEELRDSGLEIDRRTVPLAPAGAFYYFELIGCLCEDMQTGELGEVERVIDDGGGLLLEIRGESKNLLVPFVSEYLREVDVGGRRIEMDLPEDLIEICTSQY